MKNNKPILYQYILCPFSRKVRVFLAELKYDYTIQQIEFWREKEKIKQLNYFQTLPIFFDKINDLTIIDSNIICEYIADTVSSQSLIGYSMQNKIEIKRLINGFDYKFFEDVGRNILYERIINFLAENKNPNLNLIRRSKQKIGYYLEYLEQLINNRRWLAGNMFSLADITIACHLSVLDYVGEVHWDDYAILKKWYAVVKSRPSFAGILQDKITQLPPVLHYSNLDF